MDERSPNRWQHRLNREHPTCTGRIKLAHRECGWKGGDSGDSAGEKPCPTKNKIKSLDSDRPSHGRRFHSLSPKVCSREGFECNGDLSSTRGLIRPPGSILHTSAFNASLPDRNDVATRSDVLSGIAPNEKKICAEARGNASPVLQLKYGCREGGSSRKRIGWRETSLHQKLEFPVHTCTVPIARRRRICPRQNRDSSIM